MRIKSSALLLVSVLVSTTACDKGGAAKSEAKDDAPATDGVDGGGGGDPECDTTAGKVVVGGECQDNEDTIEDKDSDLGLQGGTLDVAVVQTGKVALDTTASLVGQADETQLKSLKYRFESIQICKDMQINGTGYSNPTGCLEIYKGTGGQGGYGDLPPEKTGKTPEEYDAAVEAYKAQVAKRHTDAKADTTSYIDLMDPVSIKKLSAQLKLSEKDAHEYKYGLVNWYRPIKVTAEVPLIVGAGPAQTLYTKDGTGEVEVSGVDSILKHVTKATSSMLVAPAEEAVFEHPNGGSWFNFPTPFVITKEDIVNKKNFKLELTFNPDAIVKGYDNKDGGAISHDADNVSIYVPMLHLTPVAHAADQKVLKESYLLVRDTATFQPFHLRVELYTLKGDSTKAIYGVETQTLFTPTSTQAMTDPPKAFFLEQTGDVVKLKDQGKALVAGGPQVPQTFIELPRLAAEGETGTGKVISRCTQGEGGLFHPGFLLPEHAGACNAVFEKLDDVTVTLESIAELP